MSKLLDTMTDPFVREYAEGMSVCLLELDDNDGIDKPYPYSGRIVVRAENEAGYNCTDVDILDLVAWLKKNRPDLLK